jgi:hypothetical protein
MEKSLFNLAVAKELQERCGKLNSHSAALWGSMTVTEMLHHCNKATEAILSSKPTERNSTAKQKLLKFLFLYIFKKFPKNANAPERFNVKKRQLQTQDFETELKEFSSLITQFTQHKQPINATHPVFGNLNTREWGRFTFMHLDHHLRQFGV